MKNVFEINRALAAKRNFDFLPDFCAKRPANTGGGNSQEYIAPDNCQTAVYSIAPDICRTAGNHTPSDNCQTAVDPDGTPTVRRRLSVCSYVGQMMRREYPLIPYCLRQDSEMPPSYIRLDSLSILSRQSDLAMRVWKYAAWLVTVLFGKKKTYKTPLKDRILSSIPSLCFHAPARKHVFGSHIESNPRFEEVISFHGHKQKKHFSSERMKIWKYAACMLLAFFLGVGEMWGAEIFSATPTATSDLKVKSISTYTEFKESEATIVGGTLSYKQEDSSDKGVINTSIGPSGDKRKCFRIETNKCVFKMVLSNALQNGDVISADLYNNNVELWFSTSDSRPGSAPTSKFASGGTSSAWNAKSYTVKTEDGICGQTTIYIHRNSNTTQFSYLTITRAASDAYGIHIGKNNADYTDEGMTNTSGTTWSKTIALDAGSYYEFKVKKTPSSGDAVWYGNNGAIVTNIDWNFTTGTNNAKLYTGPAGDYVFTFNTSTGNVTITYPNVEHPCANYVYFVKPNDWNAVRIYNYTSDSYRMSDWDGSPTTTQTATICGNTYYYCAASTKFDNVKWRDNNNHESAGLSTSSGLGKYFDFSVSTSAWQSFTTYTISFNAGGGTGTMSAIAGLCPNSNQTLPANTFEKASNIFNGWHADKAVKVGGSTVAIGGNIADQATLQEINNNIVLTAQWSPILVSSITVSPASKTLEVGGTQQLTATVSPDNALDKTVTWSTSDGSVATVSSTGLVTAVAPGTATITATAHDGSGKTGTCSITVVATASLTALDCNTLYKVADMVPASITLSATGQYGAGLSSNTKFEVLGDPSSTSDAAGTPEMKNEAAEFASQSFAARMYLKGASNTTGSGTTFVPTSRAVKFIVSEAGTLDIYAHRVDRLYLKKEGASSTTQLGTSTSGSGSMVSHNVTAGTYYIYATGNSTCIYGVRLNCCTAPAAPTGFTAGSITSEGATFTITDAGDAASYDIYYSTSSTAPTAGTTATTTSDSKTKAVTGLTANTTYYAWVRSVCDESHKSAWVSLSGSSFTTEAAAPASECITITNFATSNSSGTLNVYKGSVSDANKYLGKTTNNNTVGTNSGADMLLKYKSSITVYNSPTEETNFTNITEVHFDVKAKDNTKRSGFEVYVGTTKVATISGGDGGSTVFNKESYTTLDVTGLAQLTGYVRITSTSTSGAGGYDTYIDNIQICTSNTESCITPTLPTLSDQNLCAGADIAAWDATVTNAAAITSAGQEIAYSWKKKGSDTELANTASFDLSASVTEAMAGTYVVTVTVSKTGYSSATASKEVTLSVEEATEVTGITADKATVYPGNSVTLTATANRDATWQWYTCTDAEGAGESSISGATDASYTIASAGAAGTYYYKAKATGGCGVAERVYTLTVSAAAGECETYYFFANAADATTNGVSQNESSFFSGAENGTNNCSATYTVDGDDLSITKRVGSKAYSISFTIGSGKTGTIYVYALAKSGYPLKIVRSSDSSEKTITSSTSLGNYSATNIGEGTWTLSCGSGNNWQYAAIAVKVCSTASCTDATPTATATNTTVCVGSTLTLTATGYEPSPTSIQWQKLNGSAWENIEGADEATYTVASAAASDAGSYRVIVTKECARTSNTITIAVPSAPVFGDVPSLVSVMTIGSLAISSVEASDATGYKWYKSADNTYDAGSDTQVGSTQELSIAGVTEGVASPAFYLFCVASNSCGSTTSTPIAVNVTAYVEGECATMGNEGGADFGFTNTGCKEKKVESKTVWTTGGSNTNYLTYSAPDGKYLATAKVTIATSGGKGVSYGYSTDDGTSWIYVALETTTSLTQKEIALSSYGNVTDFRLGRNLGSTGNSTGELYLYEACFTYTNACTATTVTPSVSSKSHTIGDSFSAPTFTLTAAAVAAGGTLAYSSSDETIATVDSEDGTVEFQGKAGTVKITASYAGDETYCAGEGSYTITVSCPDEAPKVVSASGTNMSGCNASVPLNAKKQDGSTDFAGGSYQWFRNGEEIDGATSSSYTALQAGVYTVERTGAGGCISPSSNSVTITSETAEPEITRLVPFQYYHADKTYTEQMKDRHLFSVKGSAAYGSTGRNFKLEFSRNGGVATDVTTSASIHVVSSADGTVDTVMIDLNKLSGKYIAGDELTVTCKAVDCSGNVSETYKASVTIHVIDDTPTLALICSGTPGGDFLTVTANDLKERTDDKTWSGEWPLYTYLRTRYDVTPVNGCADFVQLNYEPFDILLLTDFPKTQNAPKPLDDMAALADYRPLLSFKTHMVQTEETLGHASKWQAKGFTSNAVVPKTCQLRADIVCYAHPMFASLSTASSEINENIDNESQKVFTLLSGAGYETTKIDETSTKKGIQGFEVTAADNFVIIAYSHFDATATDLKGGDAGKVRWTNNGKDRNLVAMCERQTNVEARMILFSLNAGAHSKLTSAGMAVVDSCLQYLLDIDPLHVSDCSLTFDNNNGTGDGKWSTVTNWLPTREEIPHANLAAHIKAPCTVDITNAEALNIRIEDEGSLTIPAGKALMVINTVKHQDGRELSPTENSDIIIGSNATGNGTLIFNNNSGDSKARVYMYSTAQADIENMSAATSTWQYIGTPHKDVAIATYNYYDSWLYQYDTGTERWVVIPNGGPLEPFRGYCVTHPSNPNVYDMTGTLVATTDVDIDIPAGKYVVTANSWVAPIDINAIQDDDMEGITDKAIYFFNTGSDPDREEGRLNTGERWAAGTYVSVPIHAAPYTGDDHIPSMQGFYVVGGSSDGVLHLSYDRHVRGTTRDNIVSGRMHAPKRVQTEDNEPEVLKLVARGNRYDDRLVVLEREDFTRNYESGWDGEAWGGSDLSPMVYITNEAGIDEAVSAIPEYEGTVITFRAGEDSEYRIEFEYSEENEPLYLLDVENNTYTQIMTGGAYYFTTSDKAPHKRFVLTRKNPQIATGVGDVQGDEVQSTKAKKLLIEDKMYILRNGILYDATGKVVK